MTAPRTSFIPEIQGLRTIALLMVATFHVWFDRVSGGVDIFLLISAYLLTRSLTARAERGQATRPLPFLVNKFARLLPAAATTIVLVVAAGLVFLPPTMWQSLFGDAFASLLYGENFRLQAAEVNYFAEAGTVASPLQHFWSLAIQGQVFVIWALLHLVAELVARASKRPLRPVLIGMFGTIFVASLAYSAWLTAENQALAYFDTLARLWEFAAGSLLALVQPWLRIPARARGVLSTAGLIGVFAGAIFLPVESSFPGVIALWPVLSAALIIVSATGPDANARPAGAGRLLAMPGLQTLGKYTYALYLVHWPVLVFFQVATGNARPNFIEGTLILAISAVLSVIIHHVVEAPTSTWLRRPSNTRPQARPLAVVGTLVMLPAILVGGSGIANEQKLARTAVAEGPVQFAQSGANASAPAIDDRFGHELVAGVATDWVLPGNECATDDPYTSHKCYEFPTAIGEEMERDIVLVGSSHANQFAGTLLETVGRQPTWQLRTYFAADCHYAYSQSVDATAECVGTWDAAGRYIVDQQPDLVVVIGTHSQVNGDIPSAGLDVWLDEHLGAAPDTQFVSIRDNPRFETSMFECGELNGFDAAECVLPYPGGDIADWQAQLEGAGVIWTDLNDGICADGLCAPTRGGLFTYMDTNHLTGDFTRTLSQLFADQVSPHVEWWPEDAYAGEYHDRIVKDRT